MNIHLVSFHKPKFFSKKQKKVPEIDVTLLNSSAQLRHLEAMVEAARGVFIYLFSYLIYLCID